MNKTPLEFISILWTMIGGKSWIIQWMTSAEPVYLVCLNIINIDNNNNNNINNKNHNNDNSTFISNSKTCKRSLSFSSLLPYSFSAFSKQSFPFNSSRSSLQAEFHQRHLHVEYQLKWRNLITMMVLCRAFEWDNHLSNPSRMSNLVEAFVERKNEPLKWL